MNSDFEKFVRQHRGEFDDSHPSDNVWKQIESTVPGIKHKKQFTLRAFYSWTAAAVALIIVSISLYFIFYKKYSHEFPVIKNELALPADEHSAGIAPEYAVIINQESREVEKRQGELRAAIIDFPDLNQKFQEDLNVLDSTYRLLKSQAAQSVNRDVIYKAMIQNLQLQSELLARQLMILQEFKTIKKPENEKDI